MGCCSRYNKCMDTDGIIFGQECEKFIENASLMCFSKCNNVEVGRVRPEKLLLHRQPRDITHNIMYGTREDSSLVHLTII